ncbi:MAG: hypothetical protein QNJ37_02100 [Crocosphaera sp.]|nr:hypothetical protein [Crocosphaera sp.]
MGQEEFYLSVYQDYREHARHSESTRETANNFMLAISAAIIGVMTNDGNLCRNDIPLCISLIVLGILGFLSSVAYTDRYQRNRIRASKIKEALDKSCNHHKTPQSLDDLEKSAEKEYNQVRSDISISNIFSISGLFKKKKVVRKSIKEGGHHLVWFLFPFVLIIVGIILIILASGKC